MNDITNTQANMYQRNKKLAQHEEWTKAQMILAVIVTSGCFAVAMVIREALI